LTRRRGARPALRLISLLGAFTLLFGAVATKLVVLQVVQAQPLGQLGANQRQDEIELQARRGSIYDRNMVPLATSAQARAVVADPSLVGDPVLVAQQLAPILEVQESLLIDKLSRQSSFVYLARGVSPSVASDALALKLPGIETREESRRIYPGDEVAGQVLGFVGVDGDGLAGLEARYNDLLSGEPGLQLVERDLAGRPIPQGRNSIREPKPGESIALTIDRSLQFYAEATLARGARAHHASDGTAIVLDPITGDVYAMASYPSMSPARFSRTDDFARRNRVVTDSYEPGSVNKVITAAAAIEAGLVTPGTTLTVPYRYRVGNKLFHDFHSHPTEKMTYAEALAESSNVATIKVAQKLGKRRLYDALLNFGFGSQTGIGFPGEASGILLRPNDWYRTSMGTIPIGQGIAVTPLQVASAYGTIANDGVRVQPRLVRGTVEGDGTLHAIPAPPARRVVSSYTAAQVRAMLTGVVERGTGRRSQIRGYLVAGKTGTARVPLEGRRGYSSKIITTFVAIAPADDARLVVLVSLNNPSPRLAAVTAAPIVKEIMQYALARLQIPPTVRLPDDSDLSNLRAQRLPSIMLPPRREDTEQALLP
jgi:cell division protein FtsI (penicillin-binding protein 3)